MKRLLFITFLVLMMPIHAYAFNFHGVKSGMTKEEIEKTMEALGAKNNKYDESKWEEFKSIGFPPVFAILKFDHNGKLLEMQLFYSTYKLPSTAIEALKHVLKSKFKATMLDLDNSIGVILVDASLMKRDIEFYKQLFLKEL